MSMVCPARFEKAFIAATTSGVRPSDRALVAASRAARTISGDLNICSVHSAEQSGVPACGTRGTTMQARSATVQMGLAA